MLGGRIGFGVVGLGLMGERHCRVISGLEGGRLAGVCDSSRALSEAVAARHETRAFLDFEELLASPEVDAVVICLPSSLHGEFGIRGALAFKHVVVEKPIDSDVELAERLVRECESRDLICAPISQYRYGGALGVLKGLVDSGVFGGAVLARASVRWFRDDEYYLGSHWRGRRAGENGGVLINQAVHAIDVLQWLFGVPAEVRGFVYGSRPDVMETEDSAVVMFRWEGGLLGTLEASTSAAPGFDEVYEVSSPVASIRIEKDRVVHWWHRDGVVLPEAGGVLADGGGVGGLEGKLRLFARQYENIIGAIRGEAELDVTPEQAVSVVRTIREIYRSAGVGG